MLNSLESNSQIIKQLSDIPQRIESSLPFSYFANSSCPNRLSAPWTEALPIVLLFYDVKYDRGGQDAHNDALST